MKFIILLLTSVIAFHTSFSQINSRVINTAVPFLDIPTSAASLGMGNIGAGTLPDDNLFYNPAKIAFSKNVHQVSLTYQPWLQEVAPDMNLSNVTYIKNGGDNNAWGLNFTYFSMGNINLRDNTGTELSTIKSNEFSLSGTYAKALGYKTSLALSFRGIYSALANLGGTPSDPFATIHPAFTAAADISFYKVVELNYSQKLMFGLNVSNIGPKIAYDNLDTTKTPLPTNMRIGFGYNNEIDEDNGFTLGFDCNKLLVPTPPIYDASGNIIKGRNPNQTVLGGMVSSFSDAPGGFAEELREVYLCFGGEYRFKDALSLRAGLDYENPSKGDRKYISTGIGYKGTLYDQKYQINLSYLVPYGNSTVISPLRNSFGFTLCYFLGDPNSK